MRDARKPIRADARKRSGVAPKTCTQAGKKFFEKTLNRRGNYEVAC